MSIYEHLWYIVETEPLTSTNSRIAQYILLNYRNIEDIRLDDIAYGSHVVKSTVSKFFKGMTENGSYDSFLSAIDVDKKDMNIRNKENKKYLNADIIEKKELKILSESIQEASRVLFFSKDIYIPCLKKFCRKLIDSGIVGKPSAYFYKESIRKEILSLDENDCVIFVDLEKSFYEYILRLGFEIDFFSIINDSKCKKLNLTKEEEKVSGVRTICLGNNTDVTELTYLYEIFDDVLINIKKSK